VPQVLYDWTYDGDPPLRGYVVVGPIGAVCAYVGVPLGTPLAGTHYEDLNLDVPGGLTFAAEGDDDHHPAGWYWFGWDYGHGWDMLLPYIPGLGMTFRRPSSEELLADVNSAVAQVRVLLENNRG
jgi:hypothetical protein